MRKSLSVLVAVVMALAVGVPTAGAIDVTNSASNFTITDYVGSADEIYFDRSGIVTRFTDYGSGSLTDRTTTSMLCETTSSQLLCTDIFWPTLTANMGHGGDDLRVSGAISSTVRLGVGDDYFEGGSGNDTVTGGTDEDTIYGNSGNDTILAADNEADDISCGSGTDVAYVDRDLDYIMDSGCNTIHYS